MARSRIVFPEVTVDLSCLPEHVRDGLALVGYWTCPPDLRDRVTGWQGLDEALAAATENDLKLLGAALLR